MPDPTLTEARRHHWRSNLRLTVALLLLWFVVVLGGALFARDINNHLLFGIPAAFYLFAQGAPILFLVIIGIHARVMNRLDHRHLAAQADDKP